MTPHKNGTLQTPPEIDKYDTHIKWCLTKMAHIAKKCPEVICRGLDRVIFKREVLNLLYDSHLATGLLCKMPLCWVVFLIRLRFL